MDDSITKPCVRCGRPLSLTEPVIRWTETVTVGGFQHESVRYAHAEHGEGELTTLRAELDRLPSF